MYNTGKRQYRQLDDSTKAKISQSLSGRSKTEDHKQAIAKALVNYWKTIPNKPEDKSNELEGI